MLASSGLVSTAPLQLRIAARPIKTRIVVSQSRTTTIDDPSSSSSISMATAPRWAQKTITLPPQTRGCHLVTSKILKEIGQDLSGFKCGLAHLFHVRDDTETFLSRIVPEGVSAPWKHTLEGPDDMPAHIKSSMFGCTLMIPITDGKLNMGTWQGIWLCEHRDEATPRRIVITLNASAASASSNKASASSRSPNSKAADLSALEALSIKISLWNLAIANSFSLDEICTSVSCSLSTVWQISSSTFLSSNSATSNLVCISSFSLHNVFASAESRAASLKFLAVAATFFSASSSGTLLSINTSLWFKESTSCWIFDFVEDSSYNNTE
nr:uncharacterized protein LOC109166322 isoform X1 [Ipomoea trifida]